MHAACSLLDAERVCHRGAPAAQRSALLME